MIPDERASRFKSGYMQDGKETVTFNPQLTVEEWEELMRCQKIVAKLEKKDGKKETEQTSEKSESTKQD